MNINMAAHNANNSGVLMRSRKKSLTMHENKVQHNSIHDAIKNGDVKELQRLVQQGCDINGLDHKFKFSPLHWAVHYGSIECLHWLLWHGADYNKLSTEGWTPVHISAIRGRHLCLQSLIANGANVNITDSRGKTAAHLAASHGKTKALQEILRKGVDEDVRDAIGWTATHTAAFHGRLGCLQVLNKWSFNMQSLDHHGNTLAHLAAGEGHLSCLKFLVAISPKIENLVKARNDQGDTPKDIAIQYSQRLCIEYLTTVEYDVEHPEVSENFAYPAHNSAYNGDLEFLKMAVSTGVASINDRDERGSTPAHKAAGNGKVEVLQWLIERGADMNILNEAGENPRDIALRFGQLGCIKLLGGESDYEDEDEGEDIIAKEPKVKAEAKDRALIKVEELKEQLEIATLNFQHLGGVLPADTERLKERQENARIIRNLEEQLEYERIKREKLECQLDAVKAQVQNLTRELEATRLMVPKPPQESPVVLEKFPKGKKKKRRIRPKSGILMVQRTPGIFEPLSSKRQSEIISPSASPLDSSSIKIGSSSSRRPKTASARIETAMSTTGKGSPRTIGQLSYDKEMSFELNRPDSGNSPSGDESIRSDSNRSHISEVDSIASHHTDVDSIESHHTESNKELDDDDPSLAEISPLEIQEPALHIREDLSDDREETQNSRPQSVDTFDTMLGEEA